MQRSSESPAILPRIMKQAAAWGTGMPQVNGEAMRQRIAEAVGSEPAESHFGAKALQGSISALSDWVMSSLSWAEASEPGALGNLSGALSELKEAARLLTTMPGALSD